MTYDQLAAHYGCNVHAIQNAMKRLGVTPRPTGLRGGYEWTAERRTPHRAAVDRPEWRAKNRENLLKRLPTMRAPSANAPLEKLLQAAETTRNAYRTRVKRTFCNSRCYGAWMSDHPEESNRKRDINWDGVAALYQNGASPDELIRQHGIGKTTLYRQLKRLGVELRRSPKPPLVSKYGDEARAHFRRGWEKRRQSGKAPTRGEDGRFIRSAG